ncbi:MAG: metallophosphoesterase [Clostridiales bacterium]|nr:metallophosphoesterase [Clostridiales bacterium]
MKNTSFYLITDSHYVSKKNWVEGKPFTFRERSDQIVLKATPEILDAFLEKIIEDKETDTVIFTGDNINNCDMNSHLEFRERLERLKSAGKKVYVIYATHDYSGSGEDNNWFKSSRYTETGTEPIEAMKRGGLFDFYSDYGPKQALSVDEESGSYSVKLGDKIRLIAIIDNGDGGGYCGLFDGGVRWLKDEIENAKKDGDRVLLAVHHPVLPPWEVYRHVAENEMYGGYRELWKIMCEEGIRVVFTGHTHIQNIRKYTDSQGRWFIDVSTIALANSAGKMRKVTYNPEDDSCEIRTVGTDGIPGLETKGLSDYEYLYSLNFPGIWEKLIPFAAENFSAFIELAEGYLPVEKLKKHKHAVSMAAGRLQKVRMSSVAKIGGAWKSLTKEERISARDKKAIDALYVILRHIFTGNAPFTPDTVEYRTFSSIAGRADKAVKMLNIKAVKKLIPAGSSLKEMADDFLYNCRTGNDDEITISLK